MSVCVCVLCTLAVDVLRRVSGTRMPTVCGGEDSCVVSQRKDHHHGESGPPPQEDTRQKK